MKDAKLFELLYISRAKPSFQVQDLTNILSSARVHNVQAEITGILLYQPGHFMQLLEGQQKNILSLYKNIALDKRHHSLRVILQGPIEKRSFANWSMACPNLEKPEIRQNPKLATLLRSDFTEEELRHQPHTWRRSLDFFLEVL